MPELVVSKIKGVDNEIVLLEMNMDSYNRSIPEIMRYLTNEKHLPGVYVTLNKPFAVLHNMLDKSEVKTDQVVFIDGVSKMSDLTIENKENCFYLRSPKDLSDMSIAVSESLNAIQHKKKFVVFDSLNTLLLYSDENIVARFLHFVIGKMRIIGANGFIIALKQGVSRTLMTELSQFCDNYITM